MMKPTHTLSIVLHSNYSYFELFMIICMCVTAILTFVENLASYKSAVSFDFTLQYNQTCWCNRLQM